MQSQRIRKSHHRLGVLSPAAVLWLGAASCILSPAPAALSAEIHGSVLINSEPASRAVAYLETPEGRPLPSSPVEKTIRQENIRFLPDFLIVPAGSTILFENHDDEIHNIYSDDPQNRFDTGAHLPRTIKRITLKYPGAVLLRCRTHPTMRGLIYVAPSDYFASTDARGEFIIRDVPPGTYRVEVWHPRLSSRERAEGGRTVTADEKSRPIEIHLSAAAAPGTDLTDTVHRNWAPIVEDIRQGLDRAIALWKKGNKTAATSAVMRTNSMLYGESGLKNRISQGLGPARATEYEQRIDALRKQVQGISEPEMTEVQLRGETEKLISELSADTQKLGVP
jgi:plastocyanin